MATPFLPGVSEAELDDVEKRFGIDLPAELRQFYIRTNGTQVRGTIGQDDNAFTFWRLDEVQPDDYFPWALTFLDYREKSWHYGVDVNRTSQFPAGRGAVYLLYHTTKMPLLVAPTFDEFLHFYIKDDERLYLSYALDYNRDLRGRG